VGRGVTLGDWHAQVESQVKRQHSTEPDGHGVGVLAAVWHWPRDRGNTASEMLFLAPTANMQKHRNTLGFISAAS